MALVYRIKEVLWASNLIIESGLHVNKPILTLNDNQVVLFMATISGSTKHAKHVDINHYFVKDIHCSSRELMLGDEHAQQLVVLYINREAPILQTHSSSMFEPMY